MAALCIRSEDVEKVQQGIKKMHVGRMLHVICAVNERLYIYDAGAGYNSKAIRTTKIVAMMKVFIDTNKSILLDNTLLFESDALVFVRQHGFNSVNEFIDDLRTTQGLPLRGSVIEWL